MKRIAIAAISLLMTVVLSAQTQAPKINFETKSHNFGQIKEADGPVTFTFKFTNIGNEPLVLKNVKASCGCTTPKWTREPVLPGDSGKINVTFNPRNRPGSFRKSITVTTNTTPANVYLSISGKVIQREKTLEEKYPMVMGKIRAQKTNLSFYNMTNTQVKTTSLKVANTTANPVVIEVPDLPKHVSFSTTTISAGKEGTIDFTYDASKKDDWGYVTDNIVLVVDGEKATTSVKLSATITEDFSALDDKDKEKAPKIVLSTSKIDFGAVQRGETVSKTFEITNSGKDPLIIHAVKSTSGIVTCSVDNDKVKAGKSAVVTVTLDTNRTKGRQYKSVSIITNDPSNPNVTFTLTGTVK